MSYPQTGSLTLVTYFARLCASLVHLGCNRARQFTTVWCPVLKLTDTRSEPEQWQWVPLHWFHYVHLILALSSYSQSLNFIMQLYICIILVRAVLTRPELVFAAYDHLIHSDRNGTLHLNNVESVGSLTTPKLHPDKRVPRHVTLITRFRQRNSYLVGVCRPVKGPP